MLNGWKNYIFYIVLLLVGVLYLQIKFVEIGNFYEVEANSKKKINLPFYNTSNQSSKLHYFEGVINSLIPQEVKLNIACDDEIREIKVNSQTITLPDKSRYTYNYRDWKYGYDFNIELLSSKNSIEIISFNKGGNYSLKIEQTISILDYTLIFILIIYPILTLLYKLYLLILDKTKEGFFKRDFFKLSYFIILLAIVLRLAYFFTYEYTLFQHDFPSHTTYIKFFAEHFEISPPDKLIQGPQQPLYYIITGSIYALLANFNFNERDIFYIISLFSVILSIISIIYAYRVLNLITEKKFIINITLGFLAFTPSFIYMSARINNDVLTMTLAIVSLYYIIKSYKSYFENSFYLAMLFTTILFFTKLSSITIVLAFFILLTITYMSNNKTELLKNRIYIFGIVGIFILGLTLFRVYLPVEEEFLFVNSGIFKGQEIGTMDINYFFSFNLSKLVELAQSFSYESRSDLVRHSFFTYQYGTMLFGEFNYSHLFAKSPFLKLLIQLIDVIAVIFIVGIGIFFLNFSKQSKLIKTLTLIFILNLALIVKFAFDYPSICNTDFRYYAPSFLVIGLLIALGLEHFANIANFIKKGIIFLTSILFTLETFFIINLILQG